MKQRKDVIRDTHMRESTARLARNIADFRCVRYANKFYYCLIVYCSKAAYYLYMYIYALIAAWRVYLSMASAARDRIK